MTTVALYGRRAIGEIISWWPIILGVIALASFGYLAYNGIDRYYRGIYAGFHYEDARGVAIRSLVVQYGRDVAADLRFAVPPVVNSHSRNLFIDGQIRIFHLRGPRGTKYCVSVWNPGSYWTGDTHTGIEVGGDTQIAKNCKF